MTRRDFLPMLIVGTGLPALAYSVYKARLAPATSGVLRPRSRKRTVADALMSDLAPGQYQNPQSKVIHHVGQRGLIQGVGRTRSDRLAKVSRIRFNRLKLFDLRELPQPFVRVGDALPKGEVTPRAQLRGASAMFEAAALERLRAGDSAGACALLDNAIRHDALLLDRTRGRRRGRDTPSFRLYDLLAGIAVRHNQYQYLNLVSELLRTRYGLLPWADVSARLAKWSNRGSKWHSDWRSDRKKWVGLSM